MNLSHMEDGKIVLAGEVLHFVFDPKTQIAEVMLIDEEDEPFTISKKEFELFVRMSGPTPDKRKHPSADPVVLSAEDEALIEATRIYSVFCERMMRQSLYQLHKLQQKRKAKS